jgi:hypothetical protein
MNQRKATATPRYRGPASLRPVPPLETIAPRVTASEWIIRTAIGYMVDGYGASDALELATARWRERSDG